MARLKRGAVTVAPNIREKKMKTPLIKNAAMTGQFMPRAGPCGCAVILTLLLTLTVAGAAPDDGSVLPFAPSPMAGVAKPRLQDSTMKMT